MKGLPEVEMDGGKPLQRWPYLTMSPLSSQDPCELDKVG